MGEAQARPEWDMLGFTRVVADALDESVAAYLRAREDSISNIESTRTRMEAADLAYLKLRQAQDMKGARPAACRVEPHKWGPPNVVPSVPVVGVERDPRFVTFEVCSGCGTLRVKTSDTGDVDDWTSHYIRRGPGE